MFKPKFNQVLVEIDDQEAKWGKGNDDNIGGEVYSQGKLISRAQIFFSYADTSRLNKDALDTIMAEIDGLKDKTIMWNEGHEAGKTFDHDGKKYAFIYWWDIVAEKE